MSHYLYLIIHTIKNTAATTTELSKLRGVSFGAYNIRSITRKFDDISIFLKRSKLNLLALNETWLNSSIADCELNIDGYAFHRFDRDLGTGRIGGGGLITYYSTKYKFAPIENWDYVYYSISNNDKEILQRSQNCALKTILKVDRLARTEHIHEVLNMDTLEVRRNKHVAVQMYRFVNNLAPSSCCDMFCKVAETHPIQTRAATNDSLHIPKMNLSVGQRNIRYYGVRVWHEADQSLKNLTSIDSFKNEIKKH